MKKFIALFLLIAVCLFAGAQNNTSTQAPNALQLKETEHDFAKIPQGKPVYYYFDVVNTGKDPLKRMYYS
jgi:hypothetical protein